MRITSEKGSKQWPRYPKAGDYKEACEDVLAFIGPGLCPNHEICEGCKFELEEAIETVKAALGQPVSRQRCRICGALDSIWWSRDPESEPVSEEDRKMWCHNCETVDPPNEFVKLPMEEA